MKQKNKKRGLTGGRAIWPWSRIGRSIFSKYFLACASVILLSFLILGTAMTILSVDYSNRQKKQLYLNSARYEAQIFSQLTQMSDMQVVDTVGTMTAVLNTVQYMSDADIIITRNDGTAFSHIFADPRDKDDIVADAIPQRIMDILAKGKTYSDMSNLGGYYSRAYMTEAVPITAGDGKEVIGAVFVTSRYGNLIGYIYDIIRIFILCLGVVLMLSFAATYLITLRLVRPLRQMSSAAKNFAKGDFSMRVPVRENDETGQLAVAFNNMAASLAQLEEMRRSFVANVSHELKTPMTSIAGFIDGILDGTIPPEKQEYYLKLVSDEVKRLSRLVRSFLDIARIEAGELKISPADFDVEETVRRVIIGFEYQISEKHLTVKGLEEDPDKKLMVHADPDQIHQIIYNLVDNAVKFANDGGYLEINVVSRDKRVYVGVKNSGMGIPAADLPYVFDRFYKTDKSRSRDRKGVGLGLYIVKSMLNLQGEDIVVRSVEGEYCEFVFTLRCA